MTRLTGWLLALAIPGGCLAMIAFHLVRRYLQRDAPDPQLKIGTPRYVFQQHDEALEARTRERREKAQALRRAAAKKESGTVEMDVTQMSSWKGKRRA